MVRPFAEREPSTLLVRHLEAESCFEARLDAAVGVLHYRRTGTGDASRLVIPSVVVDPAIQGRGVAAALTRAALDWARREGLRVEPLCPYVDAWMRRHRDDEDLRA